MQIRKQHFTAKSASDPSKVEVRWTNDENLSPVNAHDDSNSVAGDICTCFGTKKLRLAIGFALTVGRPSS